MCMMPCATPCETVSMHIAHASGAHKWGTQVGHAEQVSEIVCCGFSGSLNIRA